MNFTGLPARIVYTVVVIPAVGAAGFYSSIFGLPKLARLPGDLAIDLEATQIFHASLALAALLAFTAALLALTLPWWRRRRRSGRRVRASISMILVLLGTLSFAEQGHPAFIDLAVAFWLAYITTFTFVRYGVLDPPPRSSRSHRPAASVSAAEGESN
jgi:hypothetical protein